MMAQAIKAHILRKGSLTLMGEGVILVGVGMGELLMIASGLNNYLNLFYW